MESRNIIITGIQHWDINTASNCRNIAVEFSKTHRVLFVNPPIGRLAYISKWLKSPFSSMRNIVNGKKSNLEKKSDNLWVLNPPLVAESSNWMPAIFFKYFNKINGKRMATIIDAYSRQLCFSRLVLFTDSDMFRSLYLKEFLFPDLFIYYLRDNLMTVPFWRKHGINTASKIMTKADIVVANSLYLLNVAKEHNPRSYYVSSGGCAEPIAVKKSYSWANGVNAIWQVEEVYKSH